MKAKTTLLYAAFSTSLANAATWAGPGTGGTFEDAANWNTAYYPGGPGSPAGEDINRIPGQNGGDMTVLLNADLSGGNPTRNIRVDAGQGTSNTSLIIGPTGVVNSTNTSNSLLSINEGGPTSSASSATVEVQGSLTIGQIRLARDTDGGTSVLSVSGGGSLNMTGGGHFEMRTDSTASTGLFMMSGGTFTSGGNRNLLMGAFSSILDFSGNADFDGQNLTLQLGVGQTGATDTINVAGSSLSQVTFKAMNAFADASGSAAINFLLDPSGVTPITSLGALDLDGSTNVSPSLNVDASAYGGGAPIVLFEYGSLNGVFEVENIPAGYMVDYNYMGNNQIALVDAIPEPASTSLALIGLSFAFARRRKS